MDRTVDEEWAVVPSEAAGAQFMMFMLKFCLWQAPIGMHLVVSILRHAPLSDTFVSKLKEF